MRKREREREKLYEPKQRDEVRERKGEGKEGSTSCGALERKQGGRA